MSSPELLGRAQGWGLPQPKSKNERYDEERQQNEHWKVHRAALRRFECLHTQNEDNPRYLPHEKKEPIRRALGCREGSLGTQLKANRPSAKQEETKEKG